MDSRPRTENRFWSRASGVRLFLITALACILILVPAVAGTDAAPVLLPAGAIPDTVEVSIYIIDFNRIDVGAGTVGVDYYVYFNSDSPISIDDFELMNGVITSVNRIKDTPYEKEYRYTAVLNIDPDLSRYPFDRDTLSIRIEPRHKDEREMVLVTSPDLNGISAGAGVPGWEITGSSSAITNMSYVRGEVPYSRAVFDYGIERDAASTILKFILPLMLIMFISLSSLLMKTTSRLGLNSSMFLAAVLIHWRVADAMPIVGYATFLDLFMIITYATLVMVLLSGILTLKAIESKNTVRAEQINYWSIRVIPPVSIFLFILLFISLTF